MRSSPEERSSQNNISCMV